MMLLLQNGMSSNYVFMKSMTKLSFDTFKFDIKMYSLCSCKAGHMKVLFLTNYIITLRQ